MLNQFAKINPIVTSDGFLLMQDGNGVYNIKSTIKLKENEVGICVDDNSFIMIFKGEAIKITGGLFDTLEKAMIYASSNINNSHTGEIIHVRNAPTKLYILIGTKLFNLTENTKRSIYVALNNSSPNINLNNNIMQSPIEYINGKYIINRMDIKLGEDYSFKIISSDEDEQPTIEEYPYTVLQIRGSVSGAENIFISDGFKSNITTSILNKEFIGELSIKLYAWVNSSEGYNIGGQITEYEGNSIQITIEYTPLF